MSRDYIDESVRMPSTGKIDGVLVLIKRPGGGVRIQASRDVLNVWFGLRERTAGPVNHVDADMPLMMTVDAPSYAEAFEKLFALWAARDRAEHPAQALGHAPVPLSDRPYHQAVERQERDMRRVQGTILDVGELPVAEGKARGAIEP